jgi:hypothetical protein
MKHTDVSMTGGKVRASVYGGGELACVGGNTNVTVSDGSIGVNDVRSTGYVLFGGWRMGNVFGGGKGSTNAVIAGLVKGNATVAISGGNVYHNVYGGGAIGSVGTYTLYTDETIPDNLKEFIPVGSPMACADGTGTATVTITGGQIVKELITMQYHSEFGAIGLCNQPGCRVGGDCSSGHAQQSHGE